MEDLWKIYGRSMEDPWKISQEKRAAKPSFGATETNDLYCDLQLWMTNDLGTNRQKLVQLVLFQRNVDSKYFLKSNPKKLLQKNLLCEI